MQHPSFFVLKDYSSTLPRLHFFDEPIVYRNKPMRCAAEQLIGVLDVVQDHRQLSAEDIQLKKRPESPVAGFDYGGKIESRASV
jgi:hypothetical protein